MRITLAQQHRDAELQQIRMTPGRSRISEHHLVHVDLVGFRIEGQPPRSDAPSFGSDPAKVLPVARSQDHRVTGRPHLQPRRQLERHRSRRRGMKPTIKVGIILRTPTNQWLLRGRYE